MVALTKVQKLKRFCLICILLTDTECKPYEIKIVLSLLRHNLYFQRTAAYKKANVPSRCPKVVVLCQLSGGCVLAQGFFRGKTSIDLPVKEREKNLVSYKKECFITF